MLLLAPVGLALLLLAGSRWPPASRPTLVRVCSAAGIAHAAALAVGAGGVWRSVAIGPRPGATVGVASAASWLLVVVLDRNRGDWRTASLVGVASSALVLAAANQWVVPALLFWTCATLAFAAALRDGGTPRLLWATLFVSESLFVAATVAHAVAEDSWRLEASVEGWPALALLGAAVLRAGAFPRAGMWGALGHPAAALLPLLVTSAFVLSSPRLAEGLPWPAVLLLLGTVGISWRALARAEPRWSFGAARPVALALAIAFAVPAATASATIAATLTVAAIALWPLTAGRAQPERGLLAAFLPVTAGFPAFVVAATVAFEAAAAAATPLHALPWALVAGLLPIALLAGVLIAAQWSRHREPETFDPAGVVATWGLVAVGVGLGVLVPQGIATGMLQEGSRRLVVLHITALALGILAALIARPASAPAPARAWEPFEVDVVSEVRRGRPLHIPALTLLALASVATVAWFTLQGLRTGFL